MQENLWAQSPACARTHTPINHSCSLLISSLSPSISLLLKWTWWLGWACSKFQNQIKMDFFYIKSYHHKWNYTCMMYLGGRCLFLYTESHFTGMGYASGFSQNIQFQISFSWQWVFLCPIPFCLYNHLSLKHGSSESLGNWSYCFVIHTILQLGDHR